MKVILGIDPGSRITGYGIIQSQDHRLTYVDSGCIKTSEGSLGAKLLKIYDGICHLMDTFHPDEVAIEQVFMHQNADSALKLGHARGAAMVAAASYRRVVCEYAAREVKQSIVGYGAAQKSQVKHMVMQLLQLDQSPQSDASDALGIAICHAHRHAGQPLLTRKRKTSKRRWKV